MPYLPMMPPGAAGGQGGKERERTTWLLEDRDIWCVEGEVAPRVVRGVDPEAEVDAVEYVANTAARPTNPYPPTRPTAPTQHQQSTH